MVWYAPRPSVQLQARSPRHDRLTAADCARLHDAEALAHGRERWHPSPTDRLSRSAWIARWGTMLAERASARVDRILAGPEPPPLSQDATRTIAGILERAAATPRSEPQA